MKHLQDTLLILGFLALAGYFSYACVSTGVNFGPGVFLTVLAAIMVVPVRALCEGVFDHARNCRGC